MSRTEYGQRPLNCGNYPLPEWREFMHYMYLPVVMPGQPGLRLPPSLEFARLIVASAIECESLALADAGLPAFRLVYVTARRGFATPGNPLNRPGWHSDGFGTDDVNYVWTDRFPTDFAIQKFRGISDDHSESMRQFAIQVGGEPVHYPDSQLLRLDSSVIHKAPEIPAPGGVRSFLKVSFSNNRYNLAGNSHNHLFDYDWDMHERQPVRNDPARAASDPVTA